MQKDPNASIQAGHEWAESLDTLLAQAWKRLQRGVADRNAAGRHPTLATVDQTGMPQARTVVLRAADPDNGTLKVYSDRQAQKIHELTATPKAAIHIWDKPAHLQIRIQADGTIHTGETVRGVWEQLSDHARQCYGFEPASGDVLSDGLAYEKWPDLEAFAVIELSIQHIEVLHLGYQHRRARYHRSDDWAGEWLVP